MPLSLLIGVLTLVPVLAALVIAGLGAVRRALAPAVFVLCVLGALVPIICLLLLAPYLSSGEPVRVTLFGGSLAASAWFSAVYRADPFGIYAGLGLAILVVPLLLWMAWKGRLSPVAPATATSDIVGAAPGDMDTENLDADDELTASPARPMLSLLPSTSWAGVALTLATETAALTILFADNILWLALAWLVLAALIWGIGELGAEKVDRAGLAFALAGPVLWAVGMLLGAVPAKAPALFNLMGRGAYSPLQVIVLALAIALAGGAYPFLTWVRRRATLATPAGLGALLLVALPITIFAAARTYSAAQDVTGQWTEIGQAAPPVYGGIAWAVLGAVTVAVCGLLALERRDGRTLLAYLGAAQVGWGMLALSTGDPASLAAIVLLLAGSIFGLGAMLAAMFAGATLTDDDEEPDSAGPRAFGTRFSAASLFAWCAGAVSLIGVPLFGGFAARELLSAAALHLGNLTVPLVAIAWAGDALLALALLRAIAPAFTQLAVDADALDIEDIEDIKDGADEETLAEVAANRLDDEEPGDAIDDENRAVDEDEESDEDEAKVALRSGARRAPPAILRALPALVFGVLAVALGIVPHGLLAFGGALAAGVLAPAHAVDNALRITQVGFATGFAQWLPGLAWGALIVLALLFTFTRPDTLRGQRLPLDSTQAAAGEAGGVELAPELAGQPEPAETWQDLRAVFVSPFALPAGTWLLRDGDGEAADGAEIMDGDEDIVEPEEPEEPVEATEIPAPAAPAAEAMESALVNDDSAPPFVVAAADAGDSKNDSGEHAQVAPAATEADSAATPAPQAAESQPAPSSTTPAQPPTQPASSATKPDGAPTKPAQATPGAKPSTRPNGGRGNAPVPAKGPRPGGKKQSGGRA